MTLTTGETPERVAAKPRDSSMTGRTVKGYRTKPLKMAKVIGYREDVRGDRTYQVVIYGSS
jgi:hypothetical protein